MVWYRRASGPDQGLRRATRAYYVQLIYIRARVVATLTTDFMTLAVSPSRHRPRPAAARNRERPRMLDKRIKANFLVRYFVNIFKLVIYAKIK